MSSLQWGPNYLFHFDRTCSDKHILYRSPNTASFILKKDVCIIETSVPLVNIKLSVGIGWYLPVPRQCREMPIVSTVRQNTLQRVQTGTKVSRVQWCDERCVTERRACVITAEQSEGSLFKLKVAGSIPACSCIPLSCFTERKPQMLTD